MIYFFTTKDALVPICTYKSQDRSGAGHRMIPVTYDALSSFLEKAPSLSGETCVFADLEVLGDRGLEEAAAHHDRLAAEGATVLNHPGRTMLRAALLKTLAEQGINDHKVYGVADRSGARFPVFIRSASRHDGPYSPLLHDQKQLERAIVSQLFRGRNLDDLLIVEYRDVADENGVYRKYASFVVDGNVIPRHVLFERHWLLKSAGIEDRAAVKEEIEYVRSNPHEKELLEIARIARIDYGRIDYAVVGDKILVWEINTNPNFNLSPQNLGPPERAEVNDLFIDRLGSCLLALDRNGRTLPPTESDPLRVCEEVVIDEGHPAQLNREPSRSIVDSVTGLARPLVMPFIDRRT